jgi:hypothetical protein
VAYDPTALVVAVVGVAGTLTAPVLSQRSAARSRAADRENEAQARQAEWEREGRQRDLVERRDCYVALLVALRRVRVESREYVDALRTGGADAAARQRLEEARYNYRTRYSESSMVLPLEVEHAAREVDNRLAVLWRTINALAAATPVDADDAERCASGLLDMRTDSRRLRAVMRADLGLETDQSDGWDQY